MGAAERMDVTSLSEWTGLSVEWSEIRSTEEHSIQNGQKTPSRQTPTDAAT
jgi:hypothetical protein